MAVYYLDTGTSGLREDGMTVEKTSKSAAIRLAVSRLNVARPANEQVEAMREGLAAAGRMLRWVREHGPALKVILG